MNDTKETKATNVTETTKLLLAAALVWLLLAIAAWADQIPIPYAIAVATNVGTTSAGSVVNTTGTPYTLPRGVPYLGLLISQTCTNAGNSNNVYGFNYQVGTNWTSNTPLLITNQNNGSNTVNTYQVINTTNLPGVNAIRLDYFLTAQTNPPVVNSLNVDWTH